MQLPIFYGGRRENKKKAGFALKQDDMLIQILKQENASCIIQKGDQIFVEKGVGLKPLMMHLGENPLFFQGASVADKVIGKAAALLLLASEVHCVYGEIMSEAAVALLKKYKVPFAYGQKVPYIQNRTQTGLCPLEQAVLDIEDPSLAMTRVEVSIAELMSK